jgi:hypothetical protein
MRGLCAEMSEEDYYNCIEENWRLAKEGWPSVLYNRSSDDFVKLLDSNRKKFLIHTLEFVKV